MPRCQAPGSEDKKRQQRRQQITGTHSIFVPRSGRLLDIKEELVTLEIPRASLSVVPVASVGLAFASGPDSSRSVDGEFRKKTCFRGYNQVIEWVRLLCVWVFAYAVILTAWLHPDHVALRISRVVGRGHERCSR